MNLNAPVPRNPTHQECTDHAEIAPGAWAFWWPQMGGYCAHAVAVPDPNCCSSRRVVTPMFADLASAA